MEMSIFVEEIRGIVSLRLFDPATCERMITSVNDRAWSAATIGEKSGDRVESRVRQLYRSAFAYTPPVDSAIRKDFDLKMQTVIRPMVRQKWRRDFPRYEDTHLVRYSPGGFYVSHADAALDVNDRCFTILLYLNDNFVGGQTGFPNLSYSFTPQVGKAIVFPSTYIHRAEPVVKGQKYILVSWLVAPDLVRWI